MFDERLARAGYDDDQVQAFWRLLTSICRVGLRMTWDRRYRRGMRVPERQFHDDLHALLMADGHSYVRRRVRSLAVIPRHGLDDDDDLTVDWHGPGEECGVFGVWAPGADVSSLTFYGLSALQHRGQEAAGMAVGDGSSMTVHKGLGLVSQVFDEALLRSLQGHVAIGHARYSTTGSCTWENAQPSHREKTGAWGIALGHNGNLTNTLELARAAPGRGALPDARRATSDSDLITALLAARAGDAPTLVEAGLAVLPRLAGAFSLVFMDEGTLYAARDVHGVRPLALGSVDDGWVVASESAALDAVGARFARDVEPGELLAIDESGVRSHRFGPASPRGCLFEFVYLARADSVIGGRSVHAARVDSGRRLALVSPVDADLVMPVPQSGTPAALGYAEASRVPFGEGLVANQYVGRTFILPSTTMRRLGVRLKFNPLRDVVRDRRLVIVDDTIVRGNTMRALVRLLRTAGAREVHVRIGAPPVAWPCFYGLDFPTRRELLAPGLDEGEIRDAIGADSLAYLPVDDLVLATAQPIDSLCAACFTGDYPMARPHEGSGKQVLEANSDR